MLKNNSSGPNNLNDFNIEMEIILQLSMEFTWNVHYRTKHDSSNNERNWIHKKKPG